MHILSKLRISCHSPHAQGTDWSGGRVFGRRKGTRGRFLLPPHRGQTAESTAVYSHLTGTADYRNIGFISHLHHSRLAPSVVELLTSSVEKNNTKNTIMHLIHEGRTRVPGMGLCPASEAISVLAMELRSIRAPSADTDSKLSQSWVLSQNYHIHDFHPSFISVKTLSYWLVTRKGVRPSFSMGDDQSRIKRRGEKWRRGTPQKPTADFLFESLFHGFQPGKRKYYLCMCLICILVRRTQHYTEDLQLHTLKIQWAESALSSVITFHLGKNGRFENTAPYQLIPI